MITKELIKERAAQYQHASGYDDKCRKSFENGANWAQDTILKEIRRGVF